MDDPYTKRGINIYVPRVFSSKYIFAFMHYFEIVPQAWLNSATCHASPVYTKAGTVWIRESGILAPIRDIPLGES